MYSSRIAAERGINQIADNTVKLEAGVSKTIYIKVTAEDGQTRKIYSMQLYRQSKSSPPVFSVPNGAISEGTELILSARGEVIKYTTDGSNPSESNGVIYSEPIIIDKDITIKAVAKETDKDEYSEIITNVYRVSDGDITPEIINTNYINGGCYINFNMVNNTYSNITGVAVVALYDENDRLIDVRTKEDLNIPADSMLPDNIEMTFITEKQPKYYKLFMWNDLQQMKPILTVPQQGNFI
ncbi:MAG: chitobiase/beta-hexosaminidase C-terminal domain-containing protein [Clostridia bacterium]|nr:chitobiase/beta-hexosaminidase C-terminal domain-containing protein [Clostridia bacterium]